MALPAPGLYSIPAHRPFLDDLAAAILNQVSASSDPLALSRITVLLPTRRACRAMQDGFQRLSDGAGLILPRLVPIGDIDEDELLLTDAPGADGVADENLPPAMPELRRRLLLAEELRARFADGGAPMPVDQAVELAGELGVGRVERRKGQAARELHHGLGGGAEVEGRVEHLPRPQLLARHREGAVRAVPHEDRITARPDEDPGLLSAGVVGYTVKKEPARGKSGRIKSGTSHRLGTR